MLKFLEKNINAIIVFTALFLLIGFLNLNYHKTIDVEVFETNSAYRIYIDVEYSTLTVFKDNKIYKIYPCAGGKASTPSPIGTFNIVTKSTWGEGFGGHWMGLNVPWGKFGIHGTIYPNSIGHPASKGCIRMFNKDVAELYKFIPYGTKVIITDGPYGEFGKGFRYINPGMYGSDILAIQKRLKELKYFNGYCNGHYDVSGFKEAVNKYQKASKMYVSNTISPALIKSLGFMLFE